jgi:hypothetical protein
MRLASSQAAAGSTPAGSHQEDIRIAPIVGRPDAVPRRIVD